MPLHKIPRVSEHEDLVALQKEGERVVTIAIDGAYLLVVTDYVGVPYESRLAAVDALIERAMPGGDAPPRKSAFKAWPQPGDDAA